MRDTAGSDAQNALLGGTVDGQETVPQSFVATKAHTLNQKHLTLWAIAAEPLIFAASRAAWERLAPGDRDIVRQAAIDAAKKEVDASRAATTAAIASLGREFRARTVEVIRPSADERAAFSAATKSVYDRWAAEIGPTWCGKRKDCGRGPARAARLLRPVLPRRRTAAASRPLGDRTPPVAPPTAPAAAETSAVPTLTHRSTKRPSRTAVSPAFARRRIGMTSTQSSYGVRISVFSVARDHRAGAGHDRKAIAPRGHRKRKSSVRMGIDAVTSTNFCVSRQG